MKTTKSLTLIAAAMLLALASCKPVDDPQQVTKNVVVTTADPSFITSSTATFGAQVTADNAGLLLELGVCWSKTANPTIDGQNSKTYRCSQPYKCFVSNLEPNTTYHVRGFVQYGTEYCYGDEKTFTTLGSDVPSASPVTTLEAYDITGRSFGANATVSPFGMDYYTVGICYSTASEFTYENCQGSVVASYDSDEDVYKANCTGLRPLTTYYYRAYLRFSDTNDYTYFYGDILSVTTPEIPFELNLTTNPAEYYWGHDYAIARGELDCTDPQLVNQVGFCYSSTSAYPQFESDLHVIAATPTGEYGGVFNSYIYDLSSHTKYYIRSYARYKVDSIKYGNVVSVDTN